TMTDDRTRPDRKHPETDARSRAESRVKAALPPLTPEEEARPFAKYFYEEIKPCDPDHYALMDRPVDPARAFGPGEINRLLDVGRLETEEVESGWCLMPDGVGFVANRMFHPGVTA